MRCTFCQADNPDGARFCRACGKPLSVAPTAAAPGCPRCQASNPPGAKFCKACGASLTAAASPPPAPPPAPQPVVSPSPPRTASVKPAGNFEPQFTPPQKGSAPPTAASRTGLWIALIVLLMLLVAVAAGAAWYFLSYRQAQPSTSVLETPRETAVPPLQQPPEPDKGSEAIPEVQQNQPEERTPEVQVQTRPETESVQEAAPRPEVVQTPPPKEIRVPEPRQTPPPPPPRREPPPVKRQTPPPPPPVSQPQPVPAAPSAPSWLQELRAEWQRCASKNAFSKAICREKARNRFCPGHWDEVKECEVYQKPPDSGV